MKRLQFKLRCDTKRGKNKQEQKKIQKCDYNFYKVLCNQLSDMSAFLIAECISSFNGRFWKKGFRSNLKDEETRSVSRNSDSMSLRQLEREHENKIVEEN